MTRAMSPTSQCRPRHSWCARGCRETGMQSSAPFSPSSQQNDMWFVTWSCQGIGPASWQWTGEVPVPFACFGLPSPMVNYRVFPAAPSSSSENGTECKEDSPMLDLSYRSRTWREALLLASLNLVFRSRVTALLIPQCLRRMAARAWLNAYIGPLTEK